MKSKNFFSYIMGFTMGALVILMSLGLSSSLELQINKPLALNKNSQEVETISIEQEDNLVKDLQEKINSLETENKSLLAKIEKNESESEETVEIEIKDEMTYSKIADSLIEHEIYSHKNDLLMLLELINYDKLKGAESMRNNGIIYNVNTHKELLNNLETHNTKILEGLKKDGIIQSAEDFGKLTYLFRKDIKTNPGIKEFRKNSSLREIADKLIE
ncbi:cell division protein YceG involved in septum cleavage [Acetoanaerobium pronyense]|uniref:Cell division protein YceG involved in septum cleavage n=2 Tax=Acetoanaerobium pronyense TaxID=1482736 RepID=A0ABS4KF78_9FIRM|nr:cell division protein YceG involved in septum cleavage [Acetoanaerobium pronyense]